MPPKNFFRMVQLAEEFFDTKDDPAQLAIDESILQWLYKIHPSSVGEKENEDGPIAWTIVIPTTEAVMNSFLQGKINERELLELTPLQGVYESIYLCSALVLPEFRGKGLAKELTCNSIANIMKSHPIKSLFFWEFSVEGKNLADAVAKKTGLPLLKR